MNEKAPIALSITPLCLFLVIDVSALLHWETVIWESQREKAEFSNIIRTLNYCFFFLNFHSMADFSVSCNKIEKNPKSKENGTSVDMKVLRWCDTH